MQENVYSIYQRQQLISLICKESQTLRKKKTIEKWTKRHEQITYNKKNFLMGLEGSPKGQNGDNVTK